MRYFSLKALVINCSNAFSIALNSLYSCKYSLYAFSYAATYAVLMLTMMGTGSSLAGGINICPIRV